MASERSRWYAERRRSPTVSPPYPAELAGTPIEESGAPLEQPWAGRMDGSLARTLDS